MVTPILHGEGGFTKRKTKKKKKKKKKIETKLPVLNKKKTMKNNFFVYRSASLMCFFAEVCVVREREKTMNEKNTSWRARTFRRFYFLLSSTLIYKKKKRSMVLREGSILTGHRQVVTRR